MVYLRRRAPVALTLPLILALAAILLALVLGRPPIWSLDIGAPGDERWSGDFFDVERGDGATFRWSGAGSALWLHGADLVPSVLQLRLHGDERALRGEQGLRFTRDEQPLAEFKLQPGWRVYHTLLRSGSGGATSAVGLESSGPTLNVRGRELGVALDVMRVVPLGVSALAAPLVRALLLVWGLAVLTALVWLALGATNKSLNRGRTLLVAVMIVGLATLLIVWAQRDPFSLARTLPPIPWVLGLVTLALLVRGQGIGDTRHETREARGEARDTGRQFSILNSQFSILAPVGVLVVAQALLTTQTTVALGVGLALASLAALVYTGYLGARQDEARPDVPARMALLLLGVIVVVALGLRFYRIADLPFGLWRDEARHGLFAVQLLEEPDYRPIYLADNRIQLPALGLYPFALAIKLWGIHPWTMRPITALAGALTVLPLYGLARWLWGRRDVALLAATLLAVSSWHITISRFSFPTIFDPLLTLTGLWLFCVGFDERQRTNDERPLLAFVVRHLSFVGAGACFGLALQTYHTGRLAPLVGAAMALLVLWRSGWQWRRWLPGVGAALVGFALVAAPLVGYALRHPSAFNARTGDVFLLGAEALHGKAPLAALEESLGRHLLMFNVRGDENGRHHAPGAPMLDFFSGLGFLLGYAALLRRWRDGRNLFVFTALALGLLPSLLSVDSPHGMRAIDSLPWACVIAAVGWVELGSGVRSQGSGATPSLLHLLTSSPLHLVIVSLVALTLNYRVYFVQMAADPEVWRASYPVHTQAASYIRSVANERNESASPQIFVRSNLISNPVFTYLTHGLPVQTLTDKLAPADVRFGALFVLSGYSAERDVKRVVPYIGSAPQPFVRGPLFPDGSAPAFVVYRRTTE